MAKALSVQPTVRVYHRAKALLLVGLSLGYFMVLLDTTVVNVALPAIGHDLGGGLAGLQWVINAYTLVFAGLLLTAGTSADQFGAKRLFLTGLVVYLVASALSVIAPSLGLLIGLRALLGVGGALLLSASLTLIRHTFNDPAERARATGLWAAISGVALAAGPVTGGILVDTLGWRSIFLVNVPVALISFAIIVYMAKETPSKPRRGFDVVGQLTSMLAVAALTISLIEGGTLGWHSPLILLACGVAAISAAAFVVVEIRGTSPMLPLRLFANSTISTGIFIGAAVNFSFSGLLFVLSLYFQQVRGYSALLTGLAFLPLTIQMAFNPVLTGRIVSRIGARIPVVAGCILAGGGLLLQAQGIMHTNDGMLLIGLFLVGVGITLALPSLVVAVISAAPKDLSGTASGALNSSRQLGAVMGVALLGAILNESPTLIAGMHVALMIAGLVLLGGAPLMLAFVRRTWIS